MENHDNSAYLQAYFYANHIAYVVTDILDMLWLPEQILIAHILLMHALFVLFCTYIFYSFQTPRICPPPSLSTRLRITQLKNNPLNCFFKRCAPPRSSNPFYYAQKKNVIKTFFFVARLKGFEPLT